MVTPMIFLQTPPELRHILTDSGATGDHRDAPSWCRLVRAASEGLDLLVVVVGELPPDVPGLIPFAGSRAGEPGPIHAARTTTTSRRCSTPAARPAGPRA